MVREDLDSASNLVIRKRLNAIFRCQKVHLIVRGPRNKGGGVPVGGSSPTVLG